MKRRQHIGKKRHRVQRRRKARRPKSKALGSRTCFEEEEFMGWPISEARE